MLGPLRAIDSNRSDLSGPLEVCLSNDRNVDGNWAIH
jgi:hypothetical protein